MDEIREKYYGGDNAAREAFEELCAMVDNINASIEFLKIKNVFFKLHILTPFIFKNSLNERNEEKLQRPNWPF